MVKIDRYAVPGSDFFRWLKLFPPGAVFDLKIDIDHLWRGERAPIYRITGTVTW